MIINCTEHDIRFANGEIVKVYKPLKAKRRFETVDFGPNGQLLIKEIVEPTLEGKRLLKEIKVAFGPNVLIVGSYYSAKAYPGKVVRLIPSDAKEKIYKEDKFLVY